KGTPEPFLGMGLAEKGVDVWLWRAGWQQPVAEAKSILDSYPFDSPPYRDLTKGKENQNPDLYPARAAGNLIANVEGQSSASSLAAKGFGTTTFRPKISQLVTASSSWKDGRWTIVLRRPLSVSPDDGVALAAGDRCSIAFAIWDGEESDRNGQKLVS